MKDILRVKNLNKSYKNFSLTDVSFSLSEGCITGFIGINGAGEKGFRQYSVFWP